METHRRRTDGQGTRRSEKQQLGQNRMKEIWESIVDFFESIGRARAAAELTRLGKYDEARRLFDKDTEFHP